VDGSISCQLPPFIGFSSFQYPSGVLLGRRHLWNPPTWRNLSRRWLSWVRRLRPALPPAGNGQVLITTRSGHWPGDQAVEVPVLEQDVAAGFLAARTGDSIREAAWALAGELGGLPLAPEQAAAYITATGRDLAGYLDLFRDRREDLLDRGDPGRV
jgi:hypothetical protein